MSTQSVPKVAEAVCSVVMTVPIRQRASFPHSFGPARLHARPGLIGAQAAGITILPVAKTIELRRLLGHRTRKPVGVFLLQRFCLRRDGKR